MICFDSTFLVELIDYLFKSKVVTGENKYLIFSLVTLLFSVKIIFIVLILEKLTNVNLLNFNNYELKIYYVVILWVCGATLTAFILSVVEIVNTTIISAFVLSLTWNTLFVDVFKRFSSSKEKENPNE